MVKKQGKRAWFLAPVIAFGAATFWANRQRPARRIAGHEEIEDPVVAQSFARIASWPQMQLLRRIVIGRAMALTGEGLAADIGCGPGHLVIELAQRAPGLHLTGVDLADGMLAQATANARQAGLAGQVDFRKGDARRLPFEDGSLDLVLSTLSLHHWRQPLAVMDEIARVLRPGGAYLIFDLRRDIVPPAYTFLWFATRVVVPGSLRQINEPLASCHAAYNLAEAAELARNSSLTGWRVSPGPLWMFIEGRTLPDGDK
ncbi:MAG: methyltransferase domain-containing protein [Chloroflexota bacterium]|jgi:ubiquinone/menaquinone biosynthesis C-methylase UbiE